MSAATPALTARQQTLVLEAKTTIDMIARTVARRSPLPEDELRAIGYEVATRASKRYDESVGVPFHLFVLKAVKGAMLDAAFPKHKARHLFVREVDVVALRDEEASYFEEAELTPLEDHTVGILLSASFPSGAALERAGWQAHVVDTLRRLVDSLEPKERALVHALYWEGLPPGEASRRLNVPERSLRREHARLKAKLLRALQRHDVTELAAR